ncbi:uncharacterized protein LOC129896091 isoform X1 [Solanum dulcamara]|uniref:uncharacterized protein LOC129896091 isoform X1 n=1 Tax=Solanum dulcamara TaxID=45834 RepID=UPI002485CABA|nr:uncharacterized protein LOC129896091 isoform X1 [Solanum dulcamara]
MATFKPYTDECKDMVLDALKTDLQGATVFTDAVVEDEYLSDHTPIQVCENFVSSGRQKNILSTSNDANLCERIRSLEQSVMEVVAYMRYKKLRRIEKNKKKQAVDELKRKRKDEEKAKQKAVDEVEEQKKEEEKEVENAVDEFIENEKV